MKHIEKLVFFDIRWGRNLCEQLKTSLYFAIFCIKLIYIILYITYRYTVMSVT